MAALIAEESTMIDIVDPYLTLKGLQLIYKRNMDTKEIPGLIEIREQLERSYIMNDYLVKALAFDGQIRAYAVCTTETVGEAQKRHHTWPMASAALGRTITAGVMMGAMLKGEDKLNHKN